MQKTYLSAVLFVCLAFWGSAFAQATHPLDPLDETEIKRALKTIQSLPQWTETSMFPYLMLKEPPKAEVLAFNGGNQFRREAFAIVYDRKSGKVSEITVDLRSNKVTENKLIPNIQPPVMLSEFDAAPPIVKSDPRFKEAMNRRGIQNLDDVQVDVWAYGSPDSEHSKTARLLRAITYFKGKHKNFYARPIDGLTFLVNMNDRKVEKVIDSQVFPVPPVASDFDAKSIGKMRKDLKPLNIVQPKGPSFTVNGNEVRWQNWSFRFAMHPREGLVLYLVKYLDKGKWRSILYRGSLAEMMVPYGHNDQHWTYRAAFDEGEYGIGRYSGSLDKGTDVPMNARFFDALFVDDFGKPYVTKNAVALYERDGGMLWKHFDMYNGGNISRRGRELVISFITTVSNYDYGLNWIFNQEGVLELEVQASGIMLAKGSNLTSLNDRSEENKADLRFGHLVAPNVVAPHHQHFFNFRLDLDVDGQKNSVTELGMYAIPEGKDNPRQNAFEMRGTQLKTELEAQRNLDVASQRKWIIHNDSSKNSLGYSAGYLLYPGINSTPFLLKDAALRTRGSFVNNQVWFTQQRDDEMYAAGVYPTQRAEPDGLPVWTKKNRSLDNEDVVLWYTFGLSHAPRPEEWPVMNTHKIGFKLMPIGFFDHNPAIDVP